MPPEPPSAPDPWAPLRPYTPSRIGLGRTGDAPSLTSVLDFQLAHARARDAVHAPLDTAALLAELGDARAFHLRSRAPDRGTYLRRPDLGRRLDPASLAALPRGEWDAVFVLGDGLSATAVQRHAVPLLRELLPLLGGLRLAPPVVAREARVALGDEIGAAVGARLAVVLIGERPGLSVADSLGAYLTHAPRLGRRDAERNCVSNIHPHGGLSYAAAAGKIAWLMRAALRLGLTGVALKDDQPVLEGGTEPPALEER